MSHQLQVHEFAEQDLLRLIDWYESQQIGLGERLLTDIGQAFDKLQCMPLSYALIYKNARRLTLDIFPVNIFYQIVDNQVQVFCITHGASNPNKWQNRL